MKRRYVSVRVIKESCIYGEIVHEPKDICYLCERHRINLKDEWTIIMAVSQLIYGFSLRNEIKCENGCLVVVE